MCTFNYNISITIKLVYDIFFVGKCNNYFFGIDFLIQFIINCKYNYNDDNLFCQYLTLFKTKNDLTLSHDIPKIVKYIVKGTFGKLITIIVFVYIINRHSSSRKLWLKLNVIVYSLNAIADNEYSKFGHRYWKSIYRIYGIYILPLLNSILNVRYHNIAVCSVILCS